MSTKAAIHSFQGGMVRDMDKSMVPKEKYLEARNFRLITSSGESTGALENIDGTYELEHATLGIPSGMAVAGSVNIRDTVILFLTDSRSATPSGARSMIVKITINDATETITTWQVLYDDDNTSTQLELSTANPVKAVAAYETPNIQKIYWTDGYNNIR
jgi:hypothetical protein